MTETLDRLTGDWRIWQRRRGHRFSTDDLMIASLACRVAPRARRLLDLGAGIGSVGLLSLWHLPEDARLVMVEAQAESHALAARTVALNGLHDRVELRHGDLRDPSVVPERAAYDLVTGSPPYIPIGKGMISPDPQRAAARIELRGDIYDYAAAAARALAPEGWFCVVHAAGDPRPPDAIARAGLVLRHRQDVYFRACRPASLALYAAAHAGLREDLPPVIVRDEEGRFTAQYLAIRREMGSPLAR